MFGYFIVKSGFGTINTVWVVLIKLTFRYIVTKLTIDMSFERMGSWFSKDIMVKVIVENRSCVLANGEVKFFNFFNQGLESKSSYN